MPGSPWRSADRATDRKRPTDRLLATAQRRLALTTLALLVVLIATVAATTAFVAEQSLDASVDQSLATAAQGELDRLHEEGGPLDRVEDGSDDAGTSVPGGTGAAAVVRDEDDHTPAAADTFFLDLDASGAVVGNPEHVAFTGLPDLAAVAAAQPTGRDLREVRVGGVSLRLLTMTVPNEGRPGQVVTLQAGFVLTLHDQQTAALFRTILVVAFGGLLGAGIITVLLTRRSLAPVRASLDRERRFVAAASHELRSPVALIRASAEVLAREGSVRPRGQGLVADILAEADRLGGLVAELTDLAVAEAQPALPRVRLNLADVARDVARRAGPLAERTSLTIATSADEPVPVRADRDRLVQAMVILIDNAVRHSPPRGVVTVSSARRGTAGELSVRDAGPGVPEADRERIFEPFVHGSDHAVAGGSSLTGQGADARAGLGLAIAREIVARMNGELRVEDAHPGAVFTISLPLA
jgi:signal transduction histidine kinase